MVSKVGSCRVISRRNLLSIFRNTGSDRQISELDFTSKFTSCTRSSNRGAKPIVFSLFSPRHSSLTSRLLFLFFSCLIANDRYCVTGRCTQRRKSIRDIINSSVSNSLASHEVRTDTYASTRGFLLLKSETDEIDFRVKTREKTRRRLSTVRRTRCPIYEPYFPIIERGVSRRGGGGRC